MAWQGGAVGGGVRLTKANTFSGPINVYGPVAFDGTATEDYANNLSVLQGTAQRPRRPVPSAAAPRR